MANPTNDILGHVIQIWAAHREHIRAWLANDRLEAFGDEQCRSEAQAESRQASSYCPEP
jgi:hypothetical protein